uniref:Uncharacterized protein n=1 Tax=Anguilla anguilla TaxID=7936 RepID=A0A0E9RZK9_ANGAN
MSIFHPATHLKTLTFSVGPPYTLSP